MEERPIRVAIYARVSTETQARDQTIASQVAALDERLRVDVMTLEEELTFIDDGFSGSTLVRPALERLRDVAYAGGIDRLYVHSPDRLARKYAYQVLLVEELKRCGVELIFLNHAMGSSPEGELLLQMQGMIAEYERAKFVERSRRGKRYAARRGCVHALSAAPYGYRYVCKDEGGGQAYYQVLFEEAQIVQQVFQWVGRDRWSIDAVRRRLNRDGVPTRKGERLWSRSSVAAMLRNPAYKGCAAFGKTRMGERLPRLRPARGHSEPGLPYSVYRTLPEEQDSIPVPAIVSEDLFAAAADQLAENKKRWRERPHGASHLLQGLVVCPCCGYAYHGIRVRSKKKQFTYRYYRCSGSDCRDMDEQRVCKNKQVHAETLEKAVWYDVCSLLKHPERIEQEYDRRLSREECGDNAPSRQIGNLMEKVRRGISRLIDSYEDGLLEKPEFEPRIRSAKQRLARLEEEAKSQANRELEQQELRLVFSHLQQFAQRVNEGLDRADWTTRREMIRTLVKRVEIGQECIRVIYKVNALPFDQGPARGILQDCPRRTRAMPPKSRGSPRLVSEAPPERRRPQYAHASR